MDRAQLELLREHLSPSQLRAVLIDTALKHRLESDPIDRQEFLHYLNPHLTVEALVRLVVEDVKGYDVECTEKDVLLYWLTSLVKDVLALSEYLGTSSSG